MAIKQSNMDYTLYFCLDQPGRNQMYQSYYCPDIYKVLAQQGRMPKDNTQWIMLKEKQSFGFRESVDIIYAYS